MRTQSFALLTPVALATFPAFAHDGDHSHSALAEIIAHGMTHAGHLAVLVPALALVAWGGTLLVRRTRMAQRKSDVE